MPWAIQWRSENKLNGKKEYLLGTYFGSPSEEFKGCPKLLFKTRKAARKFIEEKWGHLKSPGYLYLRKEPHGWKTPRPIKVKIVINIAIIGE